jgi:Bcr/CflA subfamily drug resistance transporter
MSHLDQKITLSLWLVLLLIGFPQLSETIYTPALPVVAKDLSASVHAVEATLAVFFIGFAIGVCLWGVCSDSIGRRKTMLIGIAIYAISSLACSFSSSVEEILFWRFLQAFGASVGSVVTQTMLRDVYDGKERGQIFSVISGVLAFSPALGPFVGGFISEYMGWRANFWLLTVMGAALFASALILLPETRPVNVAQSGMRLRIRLLKRMLSCKTLWGHVLLIGASNGVLFSFYQESPFIFIDQLGLRPSLYGLIGIVISAGAIAAATVSYRLSGRVASETLIIAGASLTVAGTLALMGVQAFGWFQLGIVEMCLVVSALFLSFLGIGLIIPNSLGIALKDFNEMAGTAGSYFGGLYYLLIASITWGMSFLHNGTIWPLVLYLSFLSLVLVLGGLIVNSESAKLNRRGYSI